MSRSAFLSSVSMKRVFPLEVGPFTYIIKSVLILKPPHSFMTKRSNDSFSFMSENATTSRSGKYSLFPLIAILLLISSAIFNLTVFPDKNFAFWTSVLSSSVGILIPSPLNNAEFLHPRSFKRSGSG